MLDTVGYHKPRRFPTNADVVSKVNCKQLCSSLEFSSKIETGHPFGLVAKLVRRKHWLDMWQSWDARMLRCSTAWFQEPFRFLLAPTSALPTMIFGTWVVLELLRDLQVHTML